MSDLPILISEYGLYLFIGIVLLASIGVFAICNAEDCPLPAECFDCKQSTCLNCDHKNLRLRSDQWVWKPDLKPSPMITGSDTADQQKPI
jgi:hypothetical protein